MSQGVEVEKNKRGRETAGDMVRSLGLVLAAVIVVWYFAQPPDSDAQAIRVIDPSGTISAFAADAPQAPVPTGLPEQWRATSATLGSGTSSVRIGWVTPAGQYAEYAASTAPAAEHLEELAGQGAERLDPVEAGGQTWQAYRDGDGSLSLARSYDGVHVVLGSKRATAGLDELRALAASLATR